MAASVGQVSQTLDEQKQAMFNRLAQRAEQLAKKNYEAYPRPRGAELPPEINRARELASQSINAPYLQEAQEAARTKKTFPQAHEQYMNPYTQKVVKNIAREGNENFQQNLMPALDAKFARLGHFGSTKHQKEAGHAARNVQKDISAQQEKALLTGYHHAAEIFNRDETREAERINTLARLGVISKETRDADINALMRQGDYSRQYDQFLRDVALQDYLKQQNYDWDQLAKWSAISSGLPMPFEQTAVGVQPQQPMMNAAGSLGQIAGSLLPAFMYPGERAAQLANQRGR